MKGYTLIRTLLRKNLVNVHGYTLIEILVAMTITALLFSAGYAGYRSFAQRQALAATARSIKSDLRLAQEYALAGKVATGCSSPLYGYRVKLSVNKYDIVAVCNVPPTPGQSEVNVKANVLFPTGTTATFTAPAFMFKVIGQGNDIAGANVVITLTQANTNNTQTVTVTAAGEIK